jgi:putative sigma-54 modulation protein
MSRKDKAAEFAEDVFDITVTGRNFVVTDAIKDYAISKISKIEKFNTRIIDVSVTMDIQKVEHRVDIVVRLDQIVIKSHAVTDNMYASIDKASDKLEAQLHRYKDRINNHHAKGVKVIDMNVNVLRPMSQQDVMEINDEIEEENQKRLLDKYHPHKIINREKSPLKTLTDGEALMKMDLSGDEFLIYRGEDTQGIKVMYRRHDGNFGVIEPKL